MSICKVCNKDFGNLRSRAKHFFWVHGLSGKEYYETYEPKFCLTCGTQIRFDVNYATKRWCSKRCVERSNVAKGRYSKAWKQGIWKHNLGYIEIHIDNYPEEFHSILKPMARKGDKWLLEHRANLAIKLGRSLHSNEHVHHKNGVRDDNRPENLEVWLRGHPTGVSSNMSMRCPSCNHEDTAHAFFMNYAS